VLTHQPHEDLVMASGTFTFITTGLTAALDSAKAAATGKNVLAHSPDVAQQLLRADLLDEIHLHLAGTDPARRGPPPVRPHWPDRPSA
jgi:dihydrofolate reductase